MTDIVIKILGYFIERFIKDQESKKAYYQFITVYTENRSLDSARNVKEIEAQKNDNQPK